MEPMQPYQFLRNTDVEISVSLSILALRWKNLSWFSILRKDPAHREGVEIQKAHPTGMSHTVLILV